MFVRNSKTQDIGPGVERADKKRKQEKKAAEAKFGELNLDNLLDDLTANPLASIKKKQKKNKKKKSANSGLSFFQASGGGGSSAASRRKAEEAIFSKSGDGGDDMGGEAAAEADVDMAEMDDAPMDVDTADEPAEVPAEAPKISRRDRLMKAAKAEKVEVSAPAMALLSDVKAESGAKPADDNAVGGNHLNAHEGGSWWDVGGENSTVGEEGGANSQAEVEFDATRPPAEQDEKGMFLRMFWIDLYEHNDQPGKLFLFGKVQIPKTGGAGEPEAKFVSCCVVVKNVQRALLVLPRQPKPDGKGGVEEPVSMGDVFHEVKKVLDPLFPPGEGSKFKCKQVERNYAFELPGVPREKSKYLKVVYPGCYKAPNSELCEKGGKTFDRIFGGRTKLQETFLLKRELMGPCWLKIRDVSLVKSQMTWCKFEVECNNPKAVQKMQSPPPSPPLVVMSLSLKTVMNPQTHAHEIVALSALTQPAVMLDGPTLDFEKKVRHFTAVRPLGTSTGSNRQFPVGFQQKLANDKKLNRMVYSHPNERALLNWSLAKLHQEDPDVIVGACTHAVHHAHAVHHTLVHRTLAQRTLAYLHSCTHTFMHSYTHAPIHSCTLHSCTSTTAGHNIFGFDLDVLVTRLFDCKIPQWSKLGRLRRKNKVECTISRPTYTIHCTNALISSPRGITRRTRRRAWEA
jgi:DNA polymerase alpha subunit A